MSPPLHALRPLALLAAACLPSLALATTDGLPAAQEAVDAVRLAPSTADLSAGPFPVIVVGPEGVVLSGPGFPPETLVPVVQGEDGALAMPPEHMMGLLVAPLYDELVEMVERESVLNLLLHGERRPAGRILVVADADVPFELLRPVLYTTGQARYWGFDLVVHNPWLDETTVVRSELPAIGNASEADEADLLGPPPLNLTVTVTSTGLQIRGGERLLARELGEDVWDHGALIPCPDDRCTRVDDYDWDRFNELLGLIKQDWPDEAEIIVVPESSTPHEVLIRVMDLARHTPVPPDFENQTDSYGLWRGERTELFDEPVVAGGIP